MKLVHFLLDETGSMEMMKATAIRDYNQYLDDLQGQPVLLCLTKFNSAKLDLVHRPLSPEDAVRLDNENYQPGAVTPLYDALAHVIKQTENIAREVEDETGERCDVLVTTLTDGQENASKEYDLDKLNELIKEHEDHWGWNFAYIGASPEAWENEKVYAGTISGQTSTLSAAGPGGYTKSMRVTSQAVADWAANEVGTRFAYTAEQKQSVKDSSEGWHDESSAGDDKGDPSSSQKGQ